MNYQDICKVKEGMSYPEAMQLMRNAPDNVEIAYWDTSLFIYNYDPKFAASDYYQLTFSKVDSSVILVGKGN